MALIRETVDKRWGKVDKNRLDGRKNWQKTKKH